MKWFLEGMTSIGEGIASIMGSLFAAPQPYHILTADEIKQRTDAAIADAWRQVGEDLRRVLPPER